MKRKQHRRTGRITGVHKGRLTVKDRQGAERLRRPDAPKKKRSAGRLSRAVKRNKSSLTTAAIAALTVALVVQSGYLWSRVLDPDSTPKGTIAHAMVRWMSSHRAGDSDTIEPAAYPVKMAVRQETGVYGLQYSANNMQEMWRQTEDLWSAAFSSLTPLTATTIEAYREALQQPMLFAEFDGSVPLSLIAGWLGTEVPQNGEDCACGGLLISKEGNNSYRLYVRDAADGSIVSGRTDLSDAVFSSMAAAFTANDCTLAAETDTMVSPDTLQFTQAQSFDAVTFQPYSGSMLPLLDALQMDGQAAQETVYQVNDGTMVYVDGDATVRVTPNSVLSYRSETGIRAYEENLRESDARQRCAQLGHVLSTALLEGMNSGGDAHLIKAYEDKQQRYVTVFALHIDGVPVDNELGYFARYVFEDGEMVQADVVLRTCEVNGDVVAVMPETVVASSRGDSAALLSLRYTDTAALRKEDSALSDYDGTGAGELLDSDEPQTDTSWVDDLTSETESGWVDSGSVDWSDTMTTPSEGVQSTLPVSGTSVSAQAEWKFLLYDVEEPQDEPTQPLPEELRPEEIDITWHMPDLLTPLGEGGTER